MLIDLGREYLEASQVGAPVTLRLECSREALTAALFGAFVTSVELEHFDDLEVATLALSQVLMHGAHTMHDAGLRYAAEAEDGRMPLSDAAWWLYCWRRCGQVFFGVPRAVAAGPKPMLTAV